MTPNNKQTYTVRPGITLIRFSGNSIRGLRIDLENTQTIREFWKNYNTTIAVENIDLS